MEQVVKETLVNTPSASPRERGCLFFIDKRTYAALAHKGADLLQLVASVQDDLLRCPGLSALAEQSLRDLNDRLSMGLFGTQDRTAVYAQRSVTETRYQQDLYECEYLQEHLGVEKYFEILPLSSAKYLVVVEKGFVHHVTSSKAALQAFLMGCLQEQVKFGCDTSQLHRTYLNLQLNDGYEQLIRLRLS